jgi:uncharacterized membrane protein YjgN (DUF898 family)
MENRSAAAPGVAGGVARIRFTGQAGEYFRIWIVNVCLSVITLGIYSAWAKVRRKRYFYGNTLLNDSGFEYLADPKAILKGRIIVFAGFAVYSVARELVPLAAGVLSLAFIGILPWLINRAARFNAVNSAYRNVRFGFSARYRETGQFLILPVVLVPLTLGLLYPYYAYRKTQFFLEHSSYGKTKVEFSASVGAYYLAFLKVSLYFLLFLVGSVVTVGIGALPLYVWFAAYRDSRLARLRWSNTRLGNLRFACAWETGGLFKLHFVNSLAVIFSLGLLGPWAAVRTARYQLERIAVVPAGEVGAFVAAEQEQVSATGDEAGDLLGFDFGL